MDRIRLSNRFLCGKLLPVCIWGLILLLAMPAVSRLELNRHSRDETDKHTILRGIAQNWIDVGLEQCRRAFYQQAERSFLEAQQLRQYLTDAEAEKLDKLLASTRAAVLEREQALEHIKTADKLIEQDKLVRARAHLENVKGSRFLTVPEQKQVLERLKRIGNQLDRREKTIDGLYGRSVALYHSGQFEKARKGFLKVARSGLSDAPPPRTAEDYLAKIDDILRSRAQSLLLTEQKPESNLPGTDAKTVKDRSADVVTKPVSTARPQELKQANKSAIVDAALALPERNGRIEAADRKRNIRRSYARAVIDDTIAKARNCINEGRFYKAKQALEAAEQALNQNRPYLVDSSFNQYRSQLVRLGKQITSGRARWLGDWDSKSAWKL